MSPFTKMPLGRAGCAIAVAASLAACLYASPALSDEPGIADNSFLIEEAYNQEQGVVQHIFAFNHQLSSGDWNASFTQEWPIRSIRHQISATLLAFDQGRVGLGDAAVNYRFQLLGREETARVAVAPRVSLVLPSSDSSRGYGGLGLGWQLNLPASFKAGQGFVFHANAGVAQTKRRRGETSREGLTYDWTAGGSGIWLATSRFNVMIETLFTRSEGFERSGARSSENVFVASPGVRWAYNLRSGAQIVPGVAVPVERRSGETHASAIAYLSIEHPFGRGGRN